jgi:hypothetical protein
VVDSPAIQNRDSVKVVDDRTNTVKHTAEKFDSAALPSKTDSPPILDKEVIKVDDRTNTANGPSVETKAAYSFTSKVTDVKVQDHDVISNVTSQDDKRAKNSPLVSAGEKDLRPELLFKELSEWTSRVPSSKIRTKDQNNENIQRPVPLAKASTISDAPIITRTSEKVPELFEPQKPQIQDYRLSIGTISVNVVAPPDSAVTNLSIKTQEKRELKSDSNDKSHGSRLNRYYVRLR